MKFAPSYSHIPNLSQRLNGRWWLREGRGRYIKSRNVSYSQNMKDVEEAETFPGTPRCMLTGWNSVFQMYLNIESYNLVNNLNIFVVVMLANESP